MQDKTIVESHLAGFRDGLLADGYDLLVDEVANGTVKLRITAGPDACADCLVPKKIMVPMLQQALKELPDVLSVDVVYPSE